MAFIKRRSLKKAFVAVFLVSAALFGVWIVNYAQSFRLEGPIPPGVEAIPADAFSRKPLIDATFLGASFEYPRSEDKPKFPMDLTFSGVIRCRDGFGQNKAPIRWTISGDSVDCYDEATSWDSIRCPKVFGEAAVWAEVSGPKEWDSPFQVRLFPNGYQEPKSKEIRIPVSKLTLCLRQKSWISPALPLRYEVWLEGATPDTVHWLKFISPIQNQGSSIIGLLLNGSQPSELTWFREPIRSAVAHLQPVSLASIDYQVADLKDWARGNNDTKSPRFYLQPDGTGIANLTWPTEYEALSVASQIQEVSQQFAVFKPCQKFSNLKPGDRLAAQAVIPIGKPLQASVDFNMPNGADYGATPIR